MSVNRLPSEMRLARSVAAENPRWADLADSEDEYAVDATSSYALAHCTDKVTSHVQVSCNAGADAFEYDDSCSTVALSEPEAIKARWADVASDDEPPTVNQRMPVEIDRRHDAKASACGTTNWTDARRQSHHAAWHTSHAALATTYSQRDPSKTNYWHREKGSVLVRADGASFPTATSRVAPAWGRRGNKEESRLPHRRSSNAFRRQPVSSKPQCQFTVGIEQDQQFQVVRKLLGSHGKNVKAIAEKSRAKLRLRGRGSGFKEGPEEQESSDPLMLCVSAVDSHSYESAKELVQALLEDVYEQYQQFCIRSGRGVVPQLQLDMHEGPRYGSY